MTNKEFSDSFTALLNSYSLPAQFGEQSSKQEIVLDEYEKSLFLTQAQLDLCISCYSGKNSAGDSFESSEEVRRALSALVKTKKYNTSEEKTSLGLSTKSKFYELPTDLAYITLEELTFNDSALGCNNGKTVKVTPIKQDEYERVKDNPFRGPNINKAIRLDSGSNQVEIISKYQFKDYLIRYVSRPTPIILEDLPNGLSIDGKSTATSCALNPNIHKTILERAVLMALRAKGINTGK